ncbi:MAG: hypothetical protein AAFP79_12255 [Pseudomonadota bacterium]
MTDDHDANEPASNEPASHEPANNGPADTLRDGHLKATIWKNEGEQGHFFSTTLARTYQDRDGNLQDSHSVGTNDLLRVAELARSAYGRSRELEHEHSQERAPEPQHEQVQERAPEPQQRVEPAPAPEPEPAPAPEPVPAPAPDLQPDREQRRQEFEAQRRDPEPSPTQSHDPSR